MVSAAGDAGGFAGVALNSPVFTSCYWDTDTSGQASSAGGTGKNTAAMMDQGTFSGWSFGVIWYMAGYPHFRTEHAYLITNLAELQLMNLDTSGDYVLASDIDASETAIWNNGDGFSPVRRVQGAFDGGGHTISGLTINRPTTDDVGLFGLVGYFQAPVPSIENLVLSDVSIIGRENVGSLVGFSTQCIIRNCRNTGTGLISTTYGNVGGLVGHVQSTSFTDCYNLCSVHSDFSEAGGLVGYSTESSYTRCYNRGPVTLTFLFGGGLLGRVIFGGSVNQCYSTGSVSGGYSDYMGGLVGGLDELNCTSSYWDVDTSGQATSPAGTGKTTEEMQQQATFTGWDFVWCWGIEEGVSYPFLHDLIPVTIDQAGAQADPADALPILFDVVFAEPVTGFEASDITIGGTATGVTVSVSGSGAVYTASVDSADHGGTIMLSIPARRCVTVSSGDPNKASASTDNSVTYDSEPWASDQTVSVYCRIPTPFAEAQFDYNDVVSPMDHVRITSAPAAGVLAYQSVPVTPPQDIPAASIADLTFTSGPHGVGAAYASFGFQVHDGSFYSVDTYTMTVDAEPPAWNGSGTWDTPANWDSGQTPGADAPAAVQSGALEVPASRQCSHVTVEGGTMTVQDLVEMRNLAVTGGAVYITGGVSIQDLTLGAGGAVYVQQTPFALTVHGSCHDNGGELRASGGGVVILEGDVYRSGGEKAISVGSALKIYSSIGTGE